MVDGFGIWDMSDKWKEKKDGRRVGNGEIREGVGNTNQIQA